MAIQSTITTKQGIVLSEAYANIAHIGVSFERSAIDASLAIFANADSRNGGKREVSAIGVSIPLSAFTQRTQDAIRAEAYAWIQSAGRDRTQAEIDAELDLRTWVSV